MSASSELALRAALSVVPHSWTQGLIQGLYRVPGFTRRIAACPVCGSAPDRVEYDGGLSPLDHCGDCGHIYSRIIPGKVILQLMYRDLEYWVQDKAHQGITRIAYGPEWNAFVQARMSAIQKAGLLRRARMKVFELGCSEGILLRELTTLGHEAVGCECNAPVANTGMEKLGVEIKIGLFEDIALRRDFYDLVLSFHTVEHLPDLSSTFVKIVEILKPDGAILIEVPVGPEEYANRDHVQFFSSESLRRLVLKYFESAETVSSIYANADGKDIGSVYGIGRHPRKGRSSNRPGG